MSDPNDMLNILQKLEEAKNNKTPSIDGTKSYSVSKDAAGMLNILEKLEAATTSAAQTIVTESKEDITLSAGAIQNNTVTVGKYNVVMEKKVVVEGIKKTFYSVTDKKGDVIYGDIALFESAMGIVKGLLFNKDHAINKIVTLDSRYGSHLSEAALYQYKAKTLKEEYKKDVAVAKQSHSISKMTQIKKQIKNLL